MRYKWKYVIYGRNKKYGPKMYAITFIKRNKEYEVFVYVCDVNGRAVGDPVIYQAFKHRIPALLFYRKQYKEFDAYVNHNN